SALPMHTSWKNSGEVLSISLVTTTSLTFGALASRLELVPTGVEMPRPQPTWTLPTSIHPSVPLWPSAIDSPLIVEPYFRYAAIDNSLVLADARSDAGAATRRAGIPAGRT